MPLKIAEIRFYHDPDTTGQPYNHESDDEEVCIRLEDGRLLYCWFFTPDQINEVMARHQFSGESNNGTYFWATNMIIIETLSKESIEKTLKHIIEVEENLSPFDEIEQE